MQEQFGYDNVMQIPGLTKIVVNMGVGEAARDAKLIERCRQGPDRDHRPEAGRRQGPQVHRAVQAARGHADRRARHTARRPDVGVPRPSALARAAAYPRLPGLSPKQFDGRGNYTFGLNEQVMFHEIDVDKVDRQRGMDITIVTTRHDRR
jgi:large subunit ribosomal protein L5